MKWIRYKFLSAEINHGTEEKPNMEQVFFEKAMPYSEDNVEIAGREAYNGAYAIEDDGQPDTGIMPSQEERISDLEAALELLLSGGDGMKPERKARIFAYNKAVKEKGEKASDLDVIVAAVAKLPPGQLRKALTDEVIAVLRKYIAEL